ncbi:hypothetical protein N9L68_07040 [bacterium]|nr:hypothetical protein [bacterium]
MLCFPEILIALEEGIVKAWSAQRLPKGYQWDGERVKKKKGSPIDWRLDASEETHMVDMEYGHSPELNHRFESQVGKRAGESKIRYLFRTDFERHGYSDGCVGCRDIASGKKRAGSFFSPHNVACRRRMEEAGKEADPDLGYIFSGAGRGWPRREESRHRGCLVERWPPR